MIKEEELQKEIKKLKDKVAKLDKIDDCAYLVYGHPIQKLMREHDKKVAELKGIQQGKEAQLKKDIEIIKKYRYIRISFNLFLKELKKQLQEQGK